MRVSWYPSRNGLEGGAMSPKRMPMIAMIAVVHKFYRVRHHWIILL